MYKTSQQYKEAIRQSHRTTTIAEVFDPNGAKLLTLYPHDGSVLVDSNARVRRSLQLSLAAPRPILVSTDSAFVYSQIAVAYATYNALAAAYANYGQAAVSGNITTTVVDPGIVPDNAADALLPYGNEIKVSRGVEVTIPNPLTYAEIVSNYATYNALGAIVTYGQLKTTNRGTTAFEMIPLGVFVITEVSFQEADGGIQVQIAAVDRSIKVSRAKLTDIYQITSGTNAGTAIAELLQNRYPDIALSFSDTAATLNATYLGSDTSSDPWADAQDIAQSVGMRLYFDANGICVLEPQRDYLNVTPDASYQDGELNVVTDVSRRISVQDTYNAVIVAGEGSGNTSSIFRGEAYDDDPASPTYRYGKYGIVPYYYSSPNIVTAAQAANTAESLLLQLRGATEEIAWTNISDASLDVEDVVRLTNAGTKVDQVLVVDSYTLPLQPDQPMSARARLVRTLAGEALGA